MKVKYIALCLLAAVSASSCSDSSDGGSTRAERRLINKGNRQYADDRFKEAIESYDGALTENSQSVEGMYNLALAQLRRAATLEADSLRQAYTENAVKLSGTVAQHGSTKPMTASRANYNLGNLAFESDDLQRALEMYKQALRLNPDDEAARRNLRITQLKIQNQQNQDQNNDQNNDQDQQDQNQNQQDQNQQNQNQDQQNQDQNQQNQDRKDQPREQEISPQASEQILKAMENKENQTRARVMRGQNNGDKAAGASGRSRKNW